MRQVNNNGGNTIDLDQVVENLDRAVNDGDLEAVLSFYTDDAL